MSLRKGIYKHQFSAASSATPVPSDTTKYWAFASVDPAKNTQSKHIANGQTSTISTPLEVTPQPDTGETVPEKYQVKAWVAKEVPNGDEGRNQILELYRDCEDDDRDAVIDLDNYTYIPIEKDTDVQTGSGMSASDIKSAVGGTGGGSSLFSSSAAHALKKDEDEAKVNGNPESDKKEDEITSTTEAINGGETSEPKIEEIKSEENGNGSADANKDDDGDVNME